MDSDSGLQNIKKMYEKLTYFDQYGASVLLFIMITIILFILISYCYVKIHAQPIIDDWPNQRCKINILPFAGFITHPEGISATDYTYQNFTECTQTILSNMTGYMVEPLTFIINRANSVVDDIKNSLNAIRAMFDKVRTFFQIMAEEIMGRIMNMMIPLQQIIISFKDVIGKIQGTMTAGLFTMLGSYYTLKSLLGAIAQFIIIILIALAVVIAVLWILPFTWGAAIANTALFVAVAIPFALVLAFMSDVLKVQTSFSIPTLPSVKCFDEDTIITMMDGREKKISEINTGDTLYNNNKVTAVIKVETKGSQMYNLHGIIVSDSHIVQYNNKWIPVCKHPDAIIDNLYSRPYLYCLNTSDKIINIKNFVFTDWDELYDNYITEVKNNNIKKVNEKTDIHTYLDGGFDKNTNVKLFNGQITKIIDINIGDILENGEKVYGIVEINGQTTEQYIYDLGKNIHIVGGPNLNICSSKFGFTSTLNLDENKKYKKKYASDNLYHLLTDKKTFHVENIKFYDYNASIDLLLDKYKGKLLSMKYV
jgi:hypothetical protein